MLNQGHRRYLHFEVKSQTLVSDSSVAAVARRTHDRHRLFRHFIRHQGQRLGRNRRIKTPACIHVGHAALIHLSAQGTGV